ncbi:MAG: phosphoglycerate mutase family protein [Acidimicrobiia bacterium]
MIFVVRHAHAGSSANWKGPGDERPLSERGHLQAKRIGEALFADGATTVFSSPYLRCVQTVSPLAAMLDIEVDELPELAEGAGGSGAARLVLDAVEGTVICSHGDVLHALGGLFAAGGAPLGPWMPFEKGAILRLERDGGRIVSASYEAPER